MILVEIQFRNAQDLGPVSIYDVFYFMHFVTQVSISFLPVIDLNSPLFSISINIFDKFVINVAELVVVDPIVSFYFNKYSDYI